VSARARGLWAAAILLTGCPERRKPVRVVHDAGPSVVVIDGSRRPPPGRPRLPLVDEVEPDDDLAHAQPLTTDKGIRGHVTPVAQPKGKPPVDIDVYSWMEPGGPADGGAREARIEVSGVPGARLSVEALDGDGHPLIAVRDAEPGAGVLLPNLAVEPGHTYYVRVTGSATGAPPDPYQLTVTSAAAPPGAEREPNDDAAHATPLAGISDASGFFGRRRDEDWLRVPLGAAPPGEAILRIELAPVEDVAVQLRVLAGDNVVASTKAQKGEELRLRNVGVPAPATDALIALKAIEGQNAEARWGLRLGIEPPLDGAEREPNDVPKDAAAHPLALPPGGQVGVSGFLWPGDVDIFRVTGTADALVTAELEGLERVDLKLDRLDATGTRVVARADDAGAGKGELLPPWPMDTDGAALFRVSARARDTAFDAPYHLTIATVPPAADLEREPNNGPSAATPWPAGAASMRGFLAPRGDEDWFRFVAPPDKARAVVELSGPTGLTVRLTDEARAPLGPSEGATRAAGPVATGKTYFVSVKGQSDKIASPRDPYTLLLRFE
jgi:hypothetical protein